MQTSNAGSFELIAASRKAPVRARTILSMGRAEPLPVVTKPKRKLKGEPDPDNMTADEILSMFTIDWDELPEQIIGEMQHSCDRYVDLKKQCRDYRRLLYKASGRDLVSRLKRFFGKRG